MIQSSKSSMETLLQELKLLGPGQIKYEALGEWIRTFDFATMDAQKWIKPPESEGSYGRNIITIEPLECVIIHWPAGAESAVHYHEGFYGYVAVLEGRGENIIYKKKDGKLIETLGVHYVKGGIMPEPDGTIHKIVNHSNTDHMVTAHFYYPALTDLTGLKIYDIEKERTGVLNEKAKSASWKEPSSAFSEIRKNDFRYISYQDALPRASHRIFPVIPKPDPETIQDMIAAYYQEQVEVYDQFDIRHDSRRKYTEKINRLIAEDIKINKTPETMLAIACGTGRRLLEIRELTGLDYEIAGVDLSAEMCEVAKARGIEAINANWVDVKMPSKLKFDVITYLYAFGHIPDSDKRKTAVQKFYEHLNPGGAVYLDAFNINDNTEWGPRVKAAWEEFNLAEEGYEFGDVFYKKMGGKELAFLHYFEENELLALFRETGFEIEWVHRIGYVHKAGENLGKENEGSFFLKAVRP